MPSPIHKKVARQTSIQSVSGACITLAAFLLAKYGGLSAEESALVAGSAVTILAGAFGFLAGYLAKEDRR